MINAQLKSSKKTNTGGKNVSTDEITQPTETNGMLVYIRPAYWSLSEGESSVIELLQLGAI